LALEPPVETGGCHALIHAKKLNQFKKRKMPPLFNGVFGLSDLKGLIICVITDHECDN